MSASGYEIRHALLSQAKDMLYEQWHMAMEAERAKAQIENRAPVLIPAPSLNEIKAAAESLYGTARILPPDCRDTALFAVVCEVRL